MFSFLSLKTFLSIPASLFLFLLGLSPLVGLLSLKGQEAPPPPLAPLASSPDTSSSIAPPSAPPAVTTPIAPTAPPRPPPPPSPPLPESLIHPAPGGPVEEFIGHRFTEEKGSGWGWIKSPTEDWRNAHWVSLRETPGHAVAPWRALGSKEADQNVEYKMWGYFAAHKVYDPVEDEMLEVFVLDHLEPLGPTEPLPRKPGPPERYAGGKKASRASSRENRPIQERDSF